MKPNNLFKALSQDETGATAVEYGLIASLVVIAALTAIASVAGENTSMWDDIETKSTAAMDNANNIGSTP